jgi:S1-C subfamily serine protease
MGAAGRVPWAVAALAVLALALSWPSDSSPSGSSTTVVSVAVRAGGQTAERGTGFAVGRDRVVTVAHLVEDGGGVSVRTRSRHVRPARVLRSDPRSDLALLAVPGLDARREPPAIGSASEGTNALLVRVREGAVTLTSAPVRRAIVAHVRGPGEGRAHRRAALELAANVSAGDSGAPVITSGGELAGVVFARSRADARTAYAVDAVAVARLLRAAGP